MTVHQRAALRLVVRAQQRRREQLDTIHTPIPLTVALALVLVATVVLAGCAGYLLAVGLRGAS